MKILLGSANRAVVKRWTDFLGSEHKLERASSVNELTGMSSRNRYGLILVHRSLVDGDFFSKLLASSPDNRFFLLSDRPDDDEGLFFLKQGIVGYGNAYISRARLTEAVRVISSGSVWVGRKVIQRLIAEVHARAQGNGSPPEAGQGIKGLTPREREIAGLIAKGRSNPEIASELRITERTVKAHLTSVYEKTKTGNRLGLALLFNRDGTKTLH
jgi:two-component system, NarL family, nitrate/nitrite response regulator NarL